MDDFSQDSAHVTSDFWLNEPTARTHEDRITHKRWAKAVLAFYACLFLAGVATVGVHRSMTTSNSIEQHVASRTDIRSRH